MYFIQSGSRIQGILFQSITIYKVELYEAKTEEAAAHSTRTPNDGSEKIHTDSRKGWSVN